MSDLVRRLSEGQHPVEVSLRPERTVQALKGSLDRGYVHIRFTNTRGGTELGVPVDRERSDLSGADFEKESGRFTVAGELSLDFVKVRCIAEIDLPSLTGQGRLEPIAESAGA
jgi:hypothetical protein